MNTMFLAVGLVGILAVISPGPDFIIVTRNSLLYSKRVGLTTALGIVTGNAWWIAASILGISIVISKTVLLWNALKWLGALYLIYLGIRGLCSRKSNATNTGGDIPVCEKRKEMSCTTAFRVGLLTNILNPKCAMFFMSFFSVIITPETPLALQWAYGAEIMFIAAGWFSLLATILSISKIKEMFQQISVWLDRVTGALLIALGIKVALYQQK